MNHKKKLIILVQAPFTDRDVSRYGVPHFQKSGIEYEVFDLTAVLFPEAAKNYRPSDVTPDPRVSVFTDMNMVVEKLARLGPEDVVWVSLNYNHRLRRILRALSKSQATFGMSNLGTVPPLEVAASPGFRFRRLLKTPRNLKDHLFYRMPLSFWGIRPLDFLLLGGEKARYRLLPAGPETRVVPAHAFDYDRFLRARNSAPLIEGEYALYHDEYIPFHPDKLYGSIDYDITVESFREKITGAFDALENSTGCRIVIAAHPRAEYDGNTRPFGNRLVTKGHTPELVRHAKFVIGHTSTSLNFAVLNHKPIALFTFSEFEGTTYGKWIESMSLHTGSPIYFAEVAHTIEWKNVLKVERDRYESYVRNYIKLDGNETLSIGEIVDKELLSSPLNNR